MARYHNRWITEFYDKPCQVPLTRIEFAESALTVHSVTVPAWEVLEKVFAKFGYEVRPPYPRGDTGAYNCRPVTGGTAPSPHSWGIAADINWSTNPYIRTPDRRKVIFGVDTDMPAMMITKVREIRTGSGQRVFFWGGDWQTIKDAMHFQVIASPSELASGIVVPSGIDEEKPMPEPTWAKPGDPIVTVADAHKVLRYQAGYQHWKDLIDGTNDELTLKVALLADRAMQLQDAAIVAYRVTKDLQP